MTKNFLLPIFFTLLVFNKINAQALLIEGDWLANELDKSVITVKQGENGKLEGIVKSSNDARMIGQRVLYDIEYDAEEDAFKGKIYSYKRKMELEGTLKAKQKGELEVTGKKLFISKTFLWKRIY